MISRPMVAGTLMGFLAGNPTLGLFTGVLIELLWLHELPVGTVIPTDDTLVAVLASGIAAAITAKTQLSDPAASGAVVFLVIAILLPLSSLSRKIECLIRNRNATILTRMETQLLAGNPDHAIALHLWGIYHFWCYNALAIFITSTLMLLIVPSINRLLPAGLIAVMDGLLIIFPLLGIASLLSSLHRKHMHILFVILALAFTCLR